MSDLLHEGPEAERFIQWICANSFFADYVFSNPKYQKGSLPKELCDALVVFSDFAIVIQVKAATHDTKSKFSFKQAIAWAQKKRDDSVAQVSGAIRALQHGMVKYLENPRRGTVPFTQSGIRHYFGISIVDSMRTAPSASPTIIHPSQGDVSILHFRPDEFREFCEELGTLGDIRDYLFFRHHARTNIRDTGCSELDIVAAYQTRYPEVKLALSGVPVAIRPGFWSDFSDKDFKRERDAQNRPSLLVDKIANGLHETRVHPEDRCDFESIDQRLAPRALRYTVFLDELARLRRAARRDIGVKILEKDRLYVSGDRPRYFAYVYDSVTPMVFVISDDDRESRMDFLRILCAESQRTNKWDRVMGFAMNSSQSPGFSIDCISRSLDWDSSEDQVCEAPESLPPLFADPVYSKTDEWSDIRQKYQRINESSKKPSFRRFKRRPRRDR